MTKKAGKKAATAADDKAEAAAPPARLVKYVVNRPYSAGEPADIVDAEVVHEYEDEEDLLRLRLINPPRGVEDDVKRVRRDEARTLGTWFDPSAPAEPTEEVAD
ncbi:MAG TPA: hypothetical protein VF659_01715 [Pyrinomonadaceae bacterium]|jgi:hypothetical protein